MLCVAITRLRKKNMFKHSTAGWSGKVRDRIKENFYYINHINFLFKGILIDANPREITSITLITFPSKLCMKMTNRYYETDFYILASILNDYGFFSPFFFSLSVSFFIKPAAWNILSWKGLSFFYITVRNSVFWQNQQIIQWTGNSFSSYGSCSPAG